MARQRLTYRERDLAAALKILRKDGIKVGRVRIDKDGVTIEPARDDGERSEADEAEAAHERMRKAIAEM